MTRALSADPQAARGHRASRSYVDDRWIDDVLRPGDLVVVAGGVGEPTPLLEHLVRAAGRLDDIEVFVGLSHSDALRDPAAGALDLVSFGAMGPLAALADRHRVAVIPCHFSDVPRLLDVRAPGRLVLAVQVAPDDGDGHSLGVSVDYTWDLVPHARAIVAEVNDRMPLTTAPRLPASVLDAVVATSRALPAVAERRRDDPVLRAIAAQVATLVPDGATLQLGVGALASFVGAALAARRGLRVRATLTGSWLLGLAESGALDDALDAVVLSEAAGTTELYEYVAGTGVLFRPVSEVLDPCRLAAVPKLVAINSALQVDLGGQVNAEQLGERYVGGIGGQADYLRAAQRAPGGASVVMLPATSSDGRHSRIVQRLHGDAVTSPRSHVDYVVTEHGIADLRGRSLQERARALVAVAAPEHRAALEPAVVEGAR